MNFNLNLKAKQNLSLAILISFLFLGVFGINIIPLFGGERMHCSLMVLGDSAAVCPQAVNWHILKWRQFFSFPIKTFLFLIILLFVVFVIKNNDKSRIFSIFKIRFLKKANFLLKLFLPLFFALSYGIIHPKIFISKAS